MQENIRRMMGEVTFFTWPAGVKHYITLHSFRRRKYNSIFQYQYLAQGYFDSWEVGGWTSDYPIERQLYLMSYSCPVANDMILYQSLTYRWTNNCISVILTMWLCTHIYWLIWLNRLRTNLTKYMHIRWNELHVCVRVCMHDNSEVKPKQGTPLLHSH